VLVNIEHRTTVHTCAKEKHADVVDALGCRQLKGSFGFVDLLQICLQESSSYAATEHRIADIAGVNVVILSVLSHFLRPSILWTSLPQTIPRPGVTTALPSHCHFDFVRHVVSKIFLSSPRGQRNLGFICKDV
jgi:hypothetical protein